MKKLFAFALAFIVFSTLVISLMSCEDDNGTLSSTADSLPLSTSESSNHVHSYEEEWTAVEAGHYKACICHPDIANPIAHIDSTDRDGICNTCNYVITEETTLSVKVVDDSGNPVRGAQIKVFSSTFEYTAETDENGCVSYNAVYFDNVKALIISVPQGYENLAYEMYQFDGTSVEITLKKI